MEYPVTMTTHVPDGTSEGVVQDIRTREPARSGELATQSYLLRYGARRCNRANGARLAYSLPTPALNSRKSSPRCPCGYGAPMG
jgi:muconolactone delta-isomerase